MSDLDGQEREALERRKISDAVAEEMVGWFHRRENLVAFTADEAQVRYISRNAAIKTLAALAAREDTERPDGERIQELEEVVRACRSALICREALTPLFAEKIRAVLRDTEQEPRR